MLVVHQGGFFREMLTPAIDQFNLGIISLLIAEDYFLVFLFKFISFKHWVVICRLGSVTSACIL